MKLTSKEMSLILSIGKNVAEVVRKSDKEFDLIFYGEGFMSWLPLACIYERLDYSHPKIAEMTDYPEMAMNGDWSAVRDSKEEKIWKIFSQFVLVI